MYPQTRSRLPGFLVLGLLLALVGCTKDLDWTSVAEGRVPLADEEAGRIDALLRASEIEPGDLAVIRGADSPRAPGNSVRIEAGHVTALTVTGIRQPTVTAELPQLRELELTGTFSSVTVRDLEALEWLVLRGGGALEVVTLRNLSSLDTLVVTDGQLVDLELDGASSLTIVELARLDLDRVPVLPPTITSLNLAGNRIRDLATLSQLPELEVLDLSDNGLESLTRLPSLPGLRVLRLDGNPLPNPLEVRSSRLPELHKVEARRTAVRALTGTGNEVELRIDAEVEAQSAFEATLERLRHRYAERPGELVSRLGSSRGTLRGTEGNCRWKTSSLSPARVSCRFTFDELEGLAAARLGKTDLALPFRGGGEPSVRVTLSVTEGRAALYLPTSHDLIALARVIEDLDPELAEAHRRPEDRFDGYRRVTATPGSPVTVEGHPTLLGDRVLIWLEALDGSARGLELVVEPSD